MEKGSGRTSDLRRVNYHIMKKLFIALLLVAVSISIAYAQEEQQQESTSTAATVPQSNETYVYANAYDGFVNVRAEPSAKSAILGKLKNGQDRLLQLDVQDSWIKVKWENGIGYVSSSLVGYTPWKPVYLGIDGRGVQGLYITYMYAYFVFSNGKFSYWYQAQGSSDTNEPLYYGTWRFEGMDIVFTTKYLTDRGKGRKESYLGAEVRLPVKSNRIGDYYKVTLDKFDDGEKYYYFGHDGYLYEREFVAERKRVNKILSRLSH